MKKALYLAAAAAASLVAGSAQAAVLTGGFTFSSVFGSYVGGSALNATGLDFGTILSGTGNGYGTNGTATISEATGSFFGYNLSTASIADIALVGSTANPYTTNPFLTLNTLLLPQLTMSFTNATVYRSPVSVTVVGNASFLSGNDVTNGTFNIVTNTDNGANNTFKLSFVASAATSPVPEPATWGMMILGFGLMGGVMRRRSTKVAFA